MKTFFGLIHEYAEGDAAVKALLESGFDPDKINVVLLENIAKNSMQAGFNRIKVDKSEELGQPGAHGLDGLLGGEKAVTVPDVGGILRSHKAQRVMTTAG